MKLSNRFIELAVEKLRGTMSDEDIVSKLSEPAVEIDYCDENISLAGGISKLGDYKYRYRENGKSSSGLYFPIEMFNRRYPSICLILWKENCFPGSVLVDIHSSRNISPNDINTDLLYLWANRYIRSGKFRPSHSHGAFMGLEGSVHLKDHLNPPNSGNASAFEWIVIKDYPREPVSEYNKNKWNNANAG